MATEANGKLTEEQRTFVVQALACFDSPSLVAKTLKREFDVVISAQSIEAYDPTKRAGRKLAEKWKLLFEETRKTFLESTASIGVANRAVRLRALDRMAAEAETRGAYALAGQLLKQAAEEVGDVFTNRRKIEGGLTLTHANRVAGRAERLAQRRQQRAPITSAETPDAGRKLHS